jgi:hypothetical protein
LTGVKLDDAWTGELLTKRCRDNQVTGLRCRLPQAGARDASTWSK